MTLWDSGAIILYLIYRYDLKHKLSFQHGTPEWYHAQPWLFFQTTGQGPYYGRAAWLKRFHYDRLPSALDRNVKVANQASAVLEGHLTGQREALGEEAIQYSAGPWLVGNKYSYVGLALISWQFLLPMLAYPEDGLDLSMCPAVAD